MNEILWKIKEFFEQNKDALVANLDTNENELLDIIKFEDKCSLQKDAQSARLALFGYGSIKSDYIPQGDKNDILIEVKYIRSKKKLGNFQHNECDIKNALSQIIEQSVVKEKLKSILIIIDNGRAKTRKWNDIEVKFISMFQQNSFGIKLVVLRVMIKNVENDGDIEIEII